ncbi:MAG: dethiobiotin synthase [Methylotenera sp.]|uniref:dethiobiotin synthase n=1 Tax=Methylotenera sp. TaxID=2051956 RepID=UPI000D4CE861|nr:dethiobiotin synthase [Methylotenera sp.]PPC82808.1 MAG: dethiobiotin synthase [Methylotenera sp.]
MKQSYFVIGTDTNVGKTYVASALVRHFAAKGYSTIGMKPIASGCMRDGNGVLLNDDVSALAAASNVPASLDLINPYRFEPAIAPHIAAAQVEKIVDSEVIKLAYQQLKALADVVIVEGAGGFLVPLNNQETLADLAVLLNIPVILVVGMRLGCINHALLTVEAIKSRGLTLAGWVANRVDAEMPVFEENLVSLQQRIAAPCISVVGWQEEVVFNANW